MFKNGRQIEVTGDNLLLYPTGGDNDLKSPAEQNLEALHADIDEVFKPLLDGLMTRAARFGGKPEWWQRFIAKTIRWQDFGEKASHNSSLTFNRGGSQSIDVKGYRQVIRKTRDQEYLGEFELKIEDQSIVGVDFKWIARPWNNGGTLESSLWDFSQDTGTYEQIGSVIGARKVKPALMKIDFSGRPDVLFRGYYPDASQDRYQKVVRRFEYNPGSDMFPSGHTLLESQCSDISRQQFLGILSGIRRLVPALEIR